MAFEPNEEQKVLKYDELRIYTDEELKNYTDEELKEFKCKHEIPDLEELEKTLKKGRSKVVIENGQITKLTKDKNGIMQREVLEV